jgi:hypothetical protein
MDKNSGKILKYELYTGLSHNRYFKEFIVNYLVSIKNAGIILNNVFLPNSMRYKNLEKFIKLSFKNISIIYSNYSTTALE